MSDVSAADAQLDVGLNSLSISPAWARVRILLNGQDAQAASLATLPLIAQMLTADEDDAQDETTVPMAGARVLGLNDVPRGWVFLDPTHYLILMNRDVLRTFAMSPAVESWLLKRFSRTERTQQPVWMPYRYDAWVAKEPWLLERSVFEIEDWLNGL